MKRMLELKAVHRTCKLLDDGVTRLFRFYLPYDRAINIGNLPQFKMLNHCGDKLVPFNHFDKLSTVKLYRRIYHNVVEFRTRLISEGIMDKLDPIFQFDLSTKR